MVRKVQGYMATGGMKIYPDAESAQEEEFVDKLAFLLKTEAKTAHIGVEEAAMLVWRHWDKIKRMKHERT